MVPITRSQMALPGVVGRLQRRSVQLASKDCHLVTQDHDLDGEVGVTAED